MQVVSEGHVMCDFRLGCAHRGETFDKIDMRIDQLIMSADVRG